MFARVLICLDDDLLSQEYSRTAEEITDAAHAKDAMRAKCVPRIAGHWLDAATTLCGTDPAAAAIALDAARRYIAWIDVGLVTNKVFAPVLFDIALSPASSGLLAAAAVRCLCAVAVKRMDVRVKVAFLRLLLSEYGGLGSPDIVLKLPPLVTTCAAEALKCYRRLSSRDADGAVVLEMLEHMLPAVFAAAESCNKEVDAGMVLEFLAGYVGVMKAPSEKQLAYLGRILEVVGVQMAYDPAYRRNLDVLDKIGSEQEDQMAEHQKDLVTLFRSICHEASSATQMFIKGLLVSALSSAEPNVEDVEVMLNVLLAW